MSKPTGYAPRQIWLHWIIVVLVAIQFLFHDDIGHAWHQALRGTGGGYEAGVLLHIGTGLLILILMIWRFAIRRGRGTPQPTQDHRLLNLAGDAVHWGLYAVLVLMPLTGLAAWFGMLHSAGEAHEILKIVLLVLIGLHVAAALFHQFVLRDNLIARMVRPAR